MPGLAEDLGGGVREVVDTYVFLLFLSVEPLTDLKEVVQSVEKNPNSVGLNLDTKPLRNIIRPS